MPIDLSREGMEFVARMAIRHPNVTFETPIWQSYSGELGAGACRGIIIGFVAAYLDSMGSSDAMFIKSYRAKLKRLDKHLSEFNARQNDWKSRRRIASEADLCQRLSQGRATGSLFAEGMSPGAVFNTSTSTFSRKGIYFIALAGHAVAYIKNLGLYSFIDPNTGEFQSRSGNELESFLSDYFREIYHGTAQAGPLGYVVHYPV